MAPKAERRCNQESTLDGLNLRSRLHYPDRASSSLDMIISEHNLRILRALLASSPLVISVGCEKAAPPDGKTSVAASSSAPSRGDAPQSPDAPLAQIKLGPRIVVDSATTQPSIEVRDSEYVVHLPLSMVETLRDSLPGFSPLPVSTWHPVRVARIAAEAPGLALPSVVIGDFDGDSRLDVAMEGNTGQVGATFMLLAKSANVRAPRLLFISRGEPIKDGRDSYLTLFRPQRINVDPELADTLNLRNDAVQVVIVEKASLIYYIDHGAIREYITSD